jgi:hypothetical protein
LTCSSLTPYEPNELFTCSKNPSHSVQDLLAYRATLLADLASGLLAAKAIDVPAGRLIGDELRSIAVDIRDLEPLGNGFSKTSS